MTQSNKEVIEAAVRIACNTADLHLTCSYPQCKCKAFPKGVQAAVEFLVKHSVEQSERK